MLSIMDDASTERFVARRASGWRQLGSVVILELEGAREPDNTDITAILAGARLNDALDRAELAVSVLESGAVRLQLGASQGVPLTRDFGFLIEDELSAAPLSVTTTEAGLHLASERHGEYGPDPEDITIEIVLDPFNLTILNASSEPVVSLAAEGPVTEAQSREHRPAPLAWLRRARPDAASERAATVSLALEPEERLFGLGERSGPLNLIGTVQEVAPVDARVPAASTSSTRRSRPPFVLSSRGYGLLLHTRAALSVDLGQSQPTEYTVLSHEADLDLVLFPSNWPRAALSAYARLTGRLEAPDIAAFSVQTAEMPTDRASSASAVTPPATPDEMRAIVQRALTAGLAAPGLWHASLSTPDESVSRAETALATRWAQLALLAPLVSTTAQFAATASEALRPAQEAYGALRDRLLPYLLHCAYEVAQSGLPMLRPLLLEHSWDADAVEIDDQLMLGRDLLLAPIFSDSADPVTRRVYLPGFANWYDWWTGTLYDGRQWIETTAPLNRLPIFVRAGTAIPLADPREAGSLSDGPVEVTRLLLFAPKDGAIGASIDLAEDEMMGVEQERGDRKARLYLEGIPSSVRDLEIVGLSASATLVDASAPNIALEPSDGQLPGQGASWASLTIRLDQGAFTAGLELSW